MVWGMQQPGPGKYGPYGDYEGEARIASGWRNRLKEHYKAQPDAEQDRLFNPPDSQARAHFYAGYVVKKFKFEVGSQPMGVKALITPIEPHEPIRFYELEKGQKTIPSIISLPSMLWAVDENVKRLIDELDPGVHQFYPFEIRNRRGKVYPVTYYMFVSGRWLESYDTTENEASKIHDGHYRSPSSQAEGKRTSMRRSVFGDAPLWWERKFRNELLCFSDEFAERLTASELWLPKFFRLKEI
ncbi:MAG: DUF1629 domain-containing protein [Pseudomonadota bacterium]